jgi:hypothetical protein
MGIINPLYSQPQDTIKTKSQNTKRNLSVSDIQDLTKDGFNFWQDKFSGHFAGIDIGFNAFASSNYSSYNDNISQFMDNNILLSNSLFINLIHQSIGLQYNRNTLGLVTGLGLQLQSYRLDKNTIIEQMPNGRITPGTLIFEDNQKSKLSSSYLIAPLLAEFQIPIIHYANRLYISAGFYAGLRLSSHTKIKYRIDRQKKKLKAPDDFSITNLKYGFMARMGYRWINIFATCDLSPFFIENMGPELTPVTFGITLIRF